MLEAVAIAGAEATIETLSELTGRSISALRCALTVLESIWVVERQGVYEFTDLRDHFAVKDACRPDRWRTGKATIARRIESSLQGCGRAEQLAQAWLSAGEIEAGLRWTRAAAVESIKSEDLVATQRVLERASEATDQLPRALELHLVSLRRRFGPIEAARTDVLEGRGREDDAGWRQGGLSLLWYASSVGDDVAVREILGSGAADLDVSGEPGPAAPSRAEPSRAGGDPRAILFKSASFCNDLCAFIPSPKAAAFAAITCINGPP